MQKYTKMHFFRQIFSTESCYKHIAGRCFPVVFADILLMIFHTCRIYIVSLAWK